MSIPTLSQNSESTFPEESSLFLGQSKAAREQLARIAKWAEESLRTAKNARWKAERQWYYNLAFYFGQQNVVFRDANQGRSYQLVVPPAPYYRARPVINRIRPIIRKEMSKLTSNKPSASIVPSSSEDKDIYAAKAGEQIWQSLYQDKKLASIIRRAVFWTSTTGNGFTKCYWDPTAVDPNVEPQIDPTTGQPSMAPAGDITFCAETPFHIFVPDLKQEEIEDQPFVIHAQMKSVEFLEQAFQQRFTTGGAVDIIEDSFLNVLGITDRDHLKDVQVLECWVKPGHLKMFPDGAMFTVANGRVIAGQEYWPYSHKKYPLAKISNVPTGKFYTESTITDLIPLQKEYNRVRGQILEAKNRMAKPQLAAELGSVDPTKITAEPGQIIFYRPGFQAPQPIPLIPLPQYVLDEQDRILADMDEISGQHEVSRGQAPPGVTAATAISYLQEMDESNLSHTFDSLEESIEKLAFMSLNYVHQYWDVPRIIKVVGIDGSFNAMTFKGSDLHDNTDIRIEAGSALPVSKAAKQALIMDLMAQGFVHPDDGLEVMEIGGINKIYEKVQVDVTQAQRENLRMSQVTAEILQEHYVESLMKDLEKAERMIVQSPEGEPLEAIEDEESPEGGGLIPYEPNALVVPVNNWDNHRVHIEIHNKYRKSQSYDQLSEEAKALFEDHVNAHITSITMGALGSIPQEMLDQDPALMMSANTPQAYSEMEERDKQMGIDRSSEGVADYQPSSGGGSSNGSTPSSPSQR